MARGEGGGGHFAERQRASKPKSFTPKVAKVSRSEDEIVESLILKPAKKRVPKPRSKPDRMEPVLEVKPRRSLSDWARRLSVGSLGKSSEAGSKTGLRAPVGIRPGAAAAESRSEWRMDEPLHGMWPGEIAAENRLREFPYAGRASFGGQQPEYNEFNNPIHDPALRRESRIRSKQSAISRKRKRIEGFGL